MKNAVFSRSDPFSESKIEKWPNPESPPIKSIPDYIVYQVVLKLVFLVTDMFPLYLIHIIKNDGLTSRFITYNFNGSVDIRDRFEGG